MIPTTTQRLTFIKDVEDAAEALCFNIAHLEHKDALENIMNILYALRIGAITYEELSLQKSVEETLATLINYHERHDAKVIESLYKIVETTVYPYRQNSLCA